jgi:hypothetical protein
MIIYGKRLYGRVDYVPNLFYVGTQFFHLYFMPIAPLTSFIILDGTENKGAFQGTKTGFSLRSILVAYLRSALTVGGMVILFAGLGSRSMLYLSLGALCLVGACCPREWLKASPERAAALATELGVSPDAWAAQVLERKHEIHRGA